MKTTDDLEFLRHSRRGPRTHENRALGPIMQALQRSGICVKTGDWTESSQVTNHRRPMRVWRSKIYK